MAARPIARMFGVIAIANVLFFLPVLVAPQDPDRVGARIRAAFATGDLGTEEYRRRDVHRGWHQYNDCLVLQLLLSRDSSRVAGALAPRMSFLRADVEANHACGALRALAMGGASRDTMATFRYARYWHGYMVPAAIALQFLDLVQLRRLLLLAVCTAIAVLAAVAVRAGPHTRRTGLAIAGVAALLWGVPYFAPGLTHGPGDSLLLLALAALVIRPAIATDMSTLLPYSAGFGASVVFFEALTGQLPIAAAWLAALVLASARDESRASVIDARLSSVAVVGAFAVGGLITVAIKQVLAALFADRSAGAVFVTKLAGYAGVPEARNGVPGLLLPYSELVRHMFVLTAWHRTAGKALAVVVAVGWLVGAARGWRHRHDVYGRDVIFLSAVALLPAVWVLVLPTHTLMHASFMVRMMVVPISLTTVALLWPSSGGSVVKARPAG